MFIFIDSAVTGCNIAIVNGDGILAMHQEPITRGHAEFIIPQFQKMMNECAQSPDDIDRIIVTVGPGSFTGLRVGLTTAKTMGYALNKPVEGISSFQTFSSAIHDDATRIVVVDTKRDDYYVQILDAAHRPMAAACCITPQAIKDLIQPDMIVTGDAVTKLTNDIDLDGVKTVQQDMIDLKSVTQSLMQNQLDFIKAEASYIRDADVSQTKASTR